MNMVEVKLQLPEELANEAKSLGLLNDEEMASGLREAIHRKLAGQRLKAMMAELHAVGDEAPSLEEIDAEVRAYRRKNREMKKHG